jgi:aspartyl aminopeptidase
MVSLIDQGIGDFEGVQPAADNLNKKILNRVLSKTIPEYVFFMQPKLISDSVEKAREIAKSYKVDNKEISDNPFFLSDEDMGINGAVGNSFALVKPGKADKPFRIIIAHSDVPSLRIPVNPVFAESNSDRAMACSSVMILTEPFGGVRPDDWYGTEVDIVGKLFIDGKEKRIELPGRIKQKSLHVDDPRFVKTFQGLKIDTGFRTAEALYSELGITSCDDFARAKLYCLPHFEGINGRMIGNELGGFGHDDRCCVWAALKAGLETLVKTDNTTMIFALDNEEIGSVGISANYRGFFENVLRETINVVYKENAKNIVVPACLNKSLLGGMPVIFADVGVGLGPEELEDPFNVDLKGASRLGWGAMINSGVTTSPKHVDKIVSLLKKQLPGRDRDFRYQIGGDYSPVDSRFSWKGDAQMYDAFGDVMPCLNIGIPVTGLHHPRAETINVFDLHWMKEVYKIYLAN